MRPKIANNHVRVLTLSVLFSSFHLLESSRTNSEDNPTKDILQDKNGSITTNKHISTKSRLISDTLTENLKEPSNITDQNNYNNNSENVTNEPHRNYVDYESPHKHKELEDNVQKYNDEVDNNDNEYLSSFESEDDENEEFLQSDNEDENLSDDEDNEFDDDDILNLQERQKSISAVSVPDILLVQAEVTTEKRADDIAGIADVRGKRKKKLMWQSKSSSDIKSGLSSVEQEGGEQIGAKYLLLEINLLDTFKYS